MLSRLVRTLFQTDPVGRRPLQPGPGAKGGQLKALAVGTGCDLIQDVDRALDALRAIGPVGRGLGHSPLSPRVRAAGRVRPCR